MKTFRLVTYNSAGITTNGFKQMCTVFPNLTKLKITTKVDGAEILKQIWSQMTQLEFLDFCGQTQTEDSMDSVLTGISTNGLQEIEMSDVFKNLEGMTNKVERREMILSLMNQHSTLPCIGNLTNLNSLTIQFIGKGVDPNQRKSLTDLSGYLGLYSLNRLKHLRVDKCELTETCCEILRKDMGLETWAFTNSGYHDIIPDLENN